MIKLCAILLVSQLICQGQVTSDQGADVNAKDVVSVARDVRARLQSILTKNKDTVGADQLVGGGGGAGAQQEATVITNQQTEPRVRLPRQVEVEPSTNDSSSQQEQAAAVPSSNNEELLVVPVLAPVPEATADVARAVVEVVANLTNNTTSQSNEDRELVIVAPVFVSPPDAVASESPQADALANTVVQIAGSLENASDPTTTGNTSVVIVTPILVAESSVAVDEAHREAVAENIAEVVEHLNAEAVDNTNEKIVVVAPVSVARESFVDAQPEAVASSIGEIAHRLASVENNGSDSSTVIMAVPVVVIAGAEQTGNVLLETESQNAALASTIGQVTKALHNESSSSSNDTTVIVVEPIVVPERSENLIGSGAAQIQTEAVANAVVHVAETIQNEAVFVAPILVQQGSSSSLPNAQADAVANTIGEVVERLDEGTNVISNETVIVLAPILSDAPTLIEAVANNVAEVVESVDSDAHSSGNATAVVVIAPLVLSDLTSESTAEDIAEARQEAIAGLVAQLQSDGVSSDEVVVVAPTVVPTDISPENFVEAEKIVTAQEAAEAVATVGSSKVVVVATVVLPDGTHSDVAEVTLKNAIAGTVAQVVGQLNQRHPAGSISNAAENGFSGNVVIVAPTVAEQQPVNTSSQVITENENSATADTAAGIIEQLHSLNVPSGNVTLVAPAIISEPNSASTETIARDQKEAITHTTSEIANNLKNEEDVLLIAPALVQERNMAAEDQKEAVAETVADVVQHLDDNQLGNSGNVLVVAPTFVQVVGDPLPETVAHNEQAATANLVAEVVEHLNSDNVSQNVVIVATSVVPISSEEPSSVAKEEQEAVAETVVDVAQQLNVENVTGGVVIVAPALAQDKPPSIVENQQEAVADTVDAIVQEMNNQNLPSNSLVVVATALVVEESPKVPADKLATDEIQAVAETVGEIAEHYMRDEATNKGDVRVVIADSIVAPEVVTKEGPAIVQSGDARRHSPFFGPDDSSDDGTSIKVEPVFLKKRGDKADLSPEQESDAASDNSDTSAASLPQTVLNLAVTELENIASSFNKIASSLTIAQKMANGVERQSRPQQKKPASSPTNWTGVKKSKKPKKVRARRSMMPKKNAPNMSPFTKRLKGVGSRRVNTKP